MTSRDFVYWFQGFLEISDAKTLDEKQLECIRKHLALVFRHEIDPSYGDAKKQQELNKIHGNPGPGKIDKNTVYRC